MNDAVLMVGPIDAELDTRVVGLAGPGHWGHCSTAHRLGPACEVYCRDRADRRWYR